MKIRYSFFLFLFMTAIRWDVLANPPDCEKFINSQDVAFADEYFAWLSEGEFDQALYVLAPNFRPQLAPLKEDFQKIFTEVRTFKKTIVGCNVTHFKGTGPSKRTVTLAYEWSSPKAWFAGHLVWQEIGGRRVVYGLQMNPLPAPLEKLNSFSLFDKGLGHWIFLILAILNPLLILWALIACIRAKIPKRKWLWGLFIIVGFFKLNLNWTTGELSGFISQSTEGFKINPISLQLFGSGYYRASDYTPWVISTSLPLGAIIFLLRRRKIENISQNEESIFKANSQI